MSRLLDRKASPEQYAAPEPDTQLLHAKVQRLQEMYNQFFGSRIHE
jgi:hypothetical protein